VAFGALGKKKLDPPNPSFSPTPQLDFMLNACQPDRCGPRHQEMVVVVAAILITLMGLSILSRMPLRCLSPVRPTTGGCLQTHRIGLAARGIVESRIHRADRSSGRQWSCRLLKTVCAVFPRSGSPMWQVVFDIRNADIKPGSSIGWRSRLGQRSPRYVPQPTPAKAGKILRCLFPSSARILQYAFTVSGGRSTTPMELHRRVGQDFRNQDSVHFQGGRRSAFTAAHEPPATSAGLIPEGAAASPDFARCQAVAVGVAGAKRHHPPGAFPRLRRPGKC